MAKKPNIKTQDDAMIVINTRSRWFNITIIALCFLVLMAVRLQQNQNTTGDEPYYLLMDYSLIHDHDFALNNNYSHKDYLNFYNNSILDRQGDTKTIKHKYAEKNYSVHGIGLPLFVAPGFAVAGKTGAVFEMLLLATGTICLTWYWCKQVTGSCKAAYLTAGFLMLCYFFNYLVGAMYPDMLIGAITVASLVMLDRFYKTRNQQLVVGALLGFLLQVHYKALSFIGLYMVAFSYKLWKTERKLPWAVISIIAVSVVYYFATLHQWFGLYSLSKIEGGQSFGANPIHNASAMLFDSNRGLLIYNPITALLFVGLPIWFKKHRESLLITLVALMPSIAVLCLIPNWNGSAAPTGRYLIEILPAFMPAIALVVIELRKLWQRITIAVLAALTFLISLDATMMRWPYIDGGPFESRAILFKQIEAHIGLPLDRMLLRYSINTTLVGGHPVIKFFASWLVLITIFSYGCYIAKTKIRPAKRLS